MFTTPFAFGVKRKLLKGNHDMTDQEINVAIADACGWCVCTRPTSIGKWWIRKDEDCKPLQDYCHDLNAMHEAEVTLQHYGVYCDEISKVMSVGRNSISLVHATARQRAEAFLRTLCRWTE